MWARLLAKFRRKSLLPLVFALTLASAVPAGAVPPDGRDGPASGQGPGGVTGQVLAVVQLGTAPLTVAVGPNAKQGGGALNATEQRNYVSQLTQQQDAAGVRVRGLGGQPVARVTKALNAIVVAIDAGQLGAVAALPDVRSVRILRNYELDLSETVPYIGATTVQEAGFDGTGVKVAVLDSGVDYTHKNLGGPGTTAAYAAAYGSGPSDTEHTTRDGLFPTGKVYEGYDFVGESWPSGPLAPDDDPIDYEGHGTHVADIIAGRSADGTHKGVAPGARVLAVKVCSAVSSSCSGVALLQGMDYALDPDGDGSITDAVDVINMSLGTSYGQAEDDLSEASANAVRSGVVVVTSAGNSADRPYIVGSPSSTTEVISVAQTQVPSARTFPLVINSPAAIAGTYRNTNTVAYAPVNADVTADVVYVGRACNGDALNPSPSGKIALVVRGTCAVSQKVRNASDAGALAVLVQNNVPGDPPTFSNGGECSEVTPFNCKPTLILTQADGQRIRDRLAPANGGTCNSGCATVNATVSDDAPISLAGSMVASSSRGPNISFNQIKPDIGAPGASLSAEVGTGDGQTAFGGTSGAAPMVAGAAALLVHAYGAIGGRTPAEIKSLLMNTAETNITTNPAASSELAPITRIGGGEVRVDRALASQTAAWDAERLTGSLSFGYRAVTGPASFTRTVLVRNYSNAARTYTITPQFRYAVDAASGAVTLVTPPSVAVPANESATFTVQLNVDASKLPAWTLNGGNQGGNGPLLQSVEFDGYINIAGGGDAVHLAWHILPHKAAAVEPSTTSLSLPRGRGTMTLSNAGGATAGRVEAFSLTGTSPQFTTPPPAPGSNAARIDLRAVGVREATVGGAPGVQFAITTYGERAHPAYPAEFDIYLDTTGDANFDYVLYNSEAGGFGLTGQTLVTVVRLSNNTATFAGFIDADLNSANAIYSAPLSAFEGTLAAGSQFRFAVYAFDNYFTGNFTDEIGDSAPMAYTLNAPRYSAVGIPSGGVPAGGATTITVRAIPGGATASPSQTGLLFLYRDGRPGREVDIVTITP
jgi:minor extracellular serine protease Vpr